MGNKISLFLFSLIVFSGCSSFPPQSPPTDLISSGAIDLVENSNSIDSKEKKILSNSIRTLQETINEQEKLIKYFFSENKLLQKVLTEKNEDLTESSRDAGFGDGIKRIALWFFMLIGSIIILSGLYIFVKNKISSVSL